MQVDSMSTAAGAVPAAETAPSALRMAAANEKALRS
jgi:hypothetical protein